MDDMSVWEDMEELESGLVGPARPMVSLTPWSTKQKLTADRVREQIVRGDNLKQEIDKMGMKKRVTRRVAEERVVNYLSGETVADTNSIAEKCGLSAASKILNDLWDRDVIRQVTKGSRNGPATWALPEATEQTSVADAVVPSPPAPAPIVDVNGSLNEIPLPPKNGASNINR
jgi:ribosomal protein S25